MLRSVLHSMTRRGGWAPARPEPVRDQTRGTRAARRSICSGCLVATSHWRVHPWGLKDGRALAACRMFTVDAVRLRLWKDGRLVPVTAKPFEVLLVLLERRDRVVTKDELLDRVWPNATVQENNLARQVATLRRALGTEAPGEYIATVAVQWGGKV